MHSRIPEEQGELDRARFDFLYDLNLKLRPSGFGHQSVLEKDKLANKWYAFLMDEVFIAAGYALKEVALLR